MLATVTLGGAFGIGICAGLVIGFVRMYLKRRHT